MGRLTSFYGENYTDCFSWLLILDSAAGSTHLTQPIDSPSISGETLITNMVTAISPDTPDKSMNYAMHALPTAESRFKLGERHVHEPIVPSLGNIWVS